VVKASTAAFATVLILTLTAASVLAATPTPAAFADKAAQGDMMEVQLAKKMLQRSHNKDVRSFAERMVKDHTQSGEELKQVASDDHLMLPTHLNAKFQGKIDKVLSSRNVDKAYISFMARDHREDVSDFSRYAAKGKDAKLRNFAMKTLPVLEKHKAIVDRINARM
jgi:putative membrane protein